MQEPPAIASYNAALDRDEQAAERYGRLVKRVDCFREGPAVLELDQADAPPCGWYLWL